ECEEAAPGRVAGAPMDRKQQRRLEAEARNQLSARRRPIEQRVQLLEAEMAQLSVEKAKLETLLSDPNLYAQQDRDRLKASLLEQGRISGRLEALEAAWLALQQQLEAFE